MSEDCLHCPGCRGTFYHRMRQCPLQDQLRRTTLGKRAGLQKPGARAIEELNDPLLRTGLPRWLDAKTLPPTFNLEYEFGPAHEQHVTWESSSSGEWTRPCFDVGKCGTDGGMKFLAPRRARRSGLAVAVFTPAGEYVLGIWSPCPDRFPTAHRAEVWAIDVALRHVTKLPLTVVTDNFNAVLAYQPGKRYCIDAARPAADLWKSIWRRIEELTQNPEDVRLVWAKGHATDAHVASGATTEHHRVLNDRADALVAKAIQRAVDERPNKAAFAIYDRQVAFYRLLGRMCSSFPDDYQDLGKPAETPSEETPPQVEAWEVDPARPHDLWQHQRGTIACARCGQVTGTTTSSALKVLARSSCRAFCDLRDHPAVAAAILETQNLLRQQDARPIEHTKPYQPVKRHKKVTRALSPFRPEPAQLRVEALFASPSAYRYPEGEVLDLRSGSQATCRGRLGWNPRAGVFNWSRTTGGTIQLLTYHGDRIMIAREGCTITWPQGFQVSFDQLDHALQTFEHMTTPTTPSRAGSAAPGKRQRA